MKGVLFVVSAPAGTGKTTLVNRLTQEFSSLKRVVTCTTRRPRPGEREGVDYRFLTEKAFQDRVERGEFLEHATVFGFHYGTLRIAVEEELAQGHHVVLVIDTQGVEQVQARMRVVSIFISPPSLSELRSRLEGRGAESEEMILRKLTQAPKELERISCYDYHIVNRDLVEAYRELRHIFLHVTQHQQEGNSGTKTSID